MTSTSRVSLFLLTLLLPFAAGAFQPFFDKAPRTLQDPAEKHAPQDCDKKLANLRQAAEMELANAQRKANQILTVYRANVILEFWEQLKPIARQVAKDKGFKMVLLKNDAIVFAPKSWI